VRRVALHVLEVEEVLPPLRHHLQVGQQVQQLSEFFLRGKGEKMLNAFAILALNVMCVL